MKLYKKEDLKFIDGRIIAETADGLVQVGVDPLVHHQLDILEEQLQKAYHILEQDAPSPVPNLDGFKREHVYEVPQIAAKTPLMDVKVKEAERIIEELRASDCADKVNEALTSMAETLEWIESEYIADYCYTKPFDLVMIGNPLELTRDEILKHLFAISQADAWKEGRKIENNLVEE